jgi:heme-degrading monooxygenase HmoA
MAVARVVEFDGVTQERVGQMQQEMQGNEPPEGLAATEVIVLHDADAEKSVVVVFFDSEDDYRRGDEILSAMPADETPGRRASVKRFDVVHRQSM